MNELQGLVLQSSDWAVLVLGPCGVETVCYVTADFQGETDSSHPQQVEHDP